MVYDPTQWDIEGLIDWHSFKDGTTKYWQAAYKKRLKTSRTFIANEYTSGIQLIWDHYYLASTADVVKWYQEGSGVVANQWIKQKFTRGSASPVISGNPSLQDRGATLSLETKDLWYGSLAVSGLRTSCVALGGSPSAYLPKWQEAYTGVLHGANDVVFVKIPATPGTRDFPYAHWHTSIALWGLDFDEDGDPHDINLYVRCGQKPTATQFDLAFTSAPVAPPDSFAVNPPRRNEEFADLDNWTCDNPNDQNWYVAIHSAQGKGVFNIVWNIHNMLDHMTVRIGTEYGKGTTGDSGALRRLKRGMRRMWAAFEGSVGLVTDAHVYYVPDCSSSVWPAWFGWTDACGGEDCDVCLRAGGSNASRAENWCDAFGGFCHVNGWRDGMRDGKSYVHEFGHYYWGLEDEYDEDAATLKRQCGHSIMGAVVAGTNYATSFCNDFNHPTDADVHSDDPDSSWQVIQDVNWPGPVLLNNDHEPDSFPYQVFNFHGSFANVIDHR